ncbi:MAG TPA: N-acetylmuramoyl-L-alanine amidase [Niabella sp.]|jgi:N-acetylmuramoyl-L-alanine amidase|nr:N-acetylmuramoyl-L-alanine amidase [Chitinophagaceae bacterium]HRN46995.1 N-acetylmuramoyl-L-alanine amidase [Niabella sp.]HRO85950.1 N-acetylmuramoyl-L-alanine amidase [Niabella sp.]
MYKLQSVIGSVILIIFLYACTPSQPTTKTNVLSNPAGSETDVKGNKRMSAWEMQNYHKNLPKAAPPAERKTPVREAKKEIKKEANPTAVVIKPEEPVSQTSVNSNTVTSASFAYRSKEYYKFITDSIQAASAKAAYYQIADSMMRMMTQLPVNSKNPAIDLTQWYTTPNFSIRKPNYVMLHHTAQTTAEQTLYTFSIQRTGVSAHYVVSRDGTVYQMLNDYMKAWHSGTGRWGSVNDMNSCSLGIEIDNNGSEPFSDAQINGLLKLLTYLKKEYQIPQENFIGHSDYAPSRKNDPSKYFPWKKLADAGFGYWYDTLNLKEPPADFNPIMALRIIGYDTKKPMDAIKAFKLHFIQNDVSSTLSDYDKKILYNVYLKYL